jgi:flagellar motor switch/type III secretory pathway protein FliN
MSDLLAMEPGQILMVGQTVGVPVECRINGKVKFRGELIQTGARRAIQLTGNSLQ